MRVLELTRSAGSQTHLVVAPAAQQTRALEAERLVKPGGGRLVWYWLSGPPVLLGGPSSRATSCGGTGTSSAAGGHAGHARAGRDARQRTGRSGRWCYGLPGRTSRGDYRRIHGELAVVLMSVRPADELPGVRQRKRPAANGKHGQRGPCLLPALPGRDPLHIEQPGLPQGADHELYSFPRIPGQPEALRRRHATIR
jgi:hypothetical protein